MSARARARQSNGPSAASRATQATAAPPAYEPPTYPLNPNAQRALAHLAQTHSLRKLKEHLGAASDCLTEDVGKVNDRVHDRSEKMHKRVGKNQEKGAEPNEELEELERQLQDVKDRAEKMTQRMDESMRKIIDGEQSVQNMEDILKAVSNQAMTASQAAQHSQSQQRRRRAAQADGDDEDEEMPDFDPTDPAGGAVTQNRQAFSLNEAFRTRLQDEKDRYQTRSLGDRYSTNNRYIGFKRTVHDALNPGEDAPPMPHAATWFNEGNTPAPGVTEAGNAHEDSDDDIAIARERISTKCPLTLQEFRQPVTSKKCPHTFEKEAIISLIGRRPQVQCPVPGCGHVCHRLFLRLVVRTVIDLIKPDYWYLRSPHRSHSCAQDPSHTKITPGRRRRRWAGQFSAEKGERESCRVGRVGLGRRRH